MQIHCENCGTVVPAENINIQEKLAVCPQCGSVFSFAEQLAGSGKRRKIKPPPSLIVTEKDQTLEISFRLLRLLKAEEHWFTLLVGAGTIVATRLAVAMFDGMDTILEGALGAAFVLAALACLYLFLTVFLNRVRITIDDRLIRVKNAPLSLGSDSLKRADAVQVRCEVASYNKDDPDNEFVDYHVQVVGHDGRKLSLVTLRRDLAFYIAHVVEDYLWGDRPLPDTADDEGEDDDERLLLQAAEDEATGADAAKSAG